jgi:hypothetical protein
MQVPGCRADLRLLKVYFQKVGAPSMPPSLPARSGRDPARRRYAVANAEE